MKIAIILNSPEKIRVKEMTENEIIYADGGYSNAKYFKDRKTLAVVGDFDTLSKVPENEKVIKLNREKDFTDGERAIYYAKEIGADEVCIYGAFGGKPEHILGNLTLLKTAWKAGLKASAKYGGRTIKLLPRGKYEIKVKKGGSFSFIPFGKNVCFGKSDGLYYPLDNLTLTPYDTRGISNIALSDKIEFIILKGETIAVYEY